MRMARTGTRGYWLLIGRAPTPPLQRKAINNCEQIKPFFLPSGLAWALSSIGLSTCSERFCPSSSSSFPTPYRATRPSRTPFRLFPLSLLLLFSPARCFPRLAFIERFRFVRAVSHDSRHCVRYFTSSFLLFIPLLSYSESSFQSHIIFISRSERITEVFHAKFNCFITQEILFKNYNYCCICIIQEL